MVDEVVSSESNTLTWSDVEYAAELAFSWFEHSGLEFGAVEWANQAWEILIQAGLATYSINDELERSQVVIRFLALADFYLEFCRIAWDESHAPDYRLWADTLEIVHVYAKQLISSDSPLNFYEDDEYELDNIDLQKLADEARDEVLAALLNTFENTSMLFASLWLSYRQEVNEDDEESEYEYIKTPSEISIDNLIQQHFPIFECLNDQFCQAFQDIKKQPIQTLGQGVYENDLETVKVSTIKPKPPLSVETFDLLAQLNEKPTGDFYLAHEEQFQKNVEDPFQELVYQVAVQLPDVIKNRLDLDKPRFVDWKNYEGSFYSKGLHPIATATLYIMLTCYSLRFGFFIPSDSIDRARLAVNCRTYPKATQIVIQKFPDKCTPVGTNKASYSLNNLEDWFKHIARKKSSIKYIYTYSTLSKYELLDSSTEEIVEQISQTFKKLFPLFLLATCHNPTPAIEEYLKSPSKKIDAKELYKQAVEEYHQGNYQESIKKFDQALQIEPEFAAAYCYRGRARAQVGDLQGARTDYIKSLRLHPNKIEISNELGDIDYLLGNYGLAIVNYNWALDINPNYALTYYNRGRAYLQLGNKRRAIEDLCRSAELFDQQGNIDNYKEAQRILKTIQLDYSEPSFTKIYQDVRSKGLHIAERTLCRYHLALKTRKFVILSGISGTGKTWLTKTYADAVEAKYLSVPVAPNWTTNEDLLGYLNPITDEEYHYTDFSKFLEEAGNEYKQAQEEKRTPKPYHLVLDEMNLARVEYYFAKFLSAMEVRMREGEAQIELAPDKQVSLPPNLYFIGTVNMDETTQGFAEKVYDRAQLIELEVFREDLEEHLGEVPYREILMNIWDSVHAVAPFAFRVLDEIKTYVEEAEKLKEAESSEKLDDVWKEALDEQLLQKILPKLKGADERVGEALKAFVEIAENEGFELSNAKAAAMLETFNKHGFTSYF